MNVRLSVNEKWTESDAWIADIFKDALIACGYDSFSDNNEGFEAYCPEECFALEQVKAIAENEFGFVEDLKIEYDTEEIVTLQLLTGQNTGEDQCGTHGEHGNHDDQQQHILHGADEGG
ncbi:MAG: hypothetical protein UHN59_08430, partial [Bacteroidales bacterium]|nr:hypothetical protein [Bacteroidales bacterium]